MIIGEAPGKVEDRTQTPFTGPAGRLLEDIWKAGKLDIDTWYLTNTVLCRPISNSSGRENLTPKDEQVKQCKDYLLQQITYINPRIIVTLGLTAAKSLLNNPSIKMYQIRGKILRPDKNFNLENTILFPMLHPAAILHTKGTDRYHQYRLDTWKDIQHLNQLIRNM